MASIRKLPSGSWQALVRRKNEPLISKTFPKKSLAVHWARSLETQIDQESQSGSAGITFGELIDRYLLEVTPTKKSIETETSCLKRLKASLGSEVMASIESKHLAAYRDKRLNQGVSGSTVRRELAHISHVFNTAIMDWGYSLPTNPVQQIRKPKTNRGRDRRLNTGELELLINALAESPELKPIVLLAIETSMRRSELLSIQWANVDLDNRFLLLPDTKNGDSRSVPLSRKAIAILSSLPKETGNTGTVFRTNPYLTS
jgi:integrase